MGLKAKLRNTMNTVLKRYDYEIVQSHLLYQWQKDLQIDPSYKASELPEDAQQYLQLHNPRLSDLQKRYNSFNTEVTAPLVWTNDLVTPEDVMYFRGDNAYVWQLRGPNMNIMAYTLTYYYVQALDKLGFLDKLQEDNLFGNFTFEIGGRLVSRDLLDSIMEIYFLDKHLKISNLDKPKILDIGAGYGRLAHRMTSALDNIGQYFCTDGVAISTFISEYHLRYRSLQDKTTVVPLDEIEQTLASEPIDLAINIHSFSECSLSAIEWWINLLKKSKVEYLMVVPNAGYHGGSKIETNDEQDFGKIINNYGYKLIAKEPKYRDPLVQEFAINPTFHYLFQLQ